MNPQAYALGALCILLGWTSSAGAGVVLSEIHSGDPEFVEFVNTSDEPVDLEGYRLTGDLQHTFLSSLIVPPGGRVLIAQSVLEFRDHFGDQPELYGCWGRIRNEGGTLRLYEPMGKLVDSARYGRYQPGRSFQRVSLSTPYRGPQNWRPAPPTPGRASGPLPPLPALLADAWTSRRDQTTVALSCQVHHKNQLRRAEFVAWGPRQTERRSPLRLSPTSTAGVTSAEAILAPQKSPSTLFCEFEFDDGTGPRRYRNPGHEGGIRKRPFVAFFADEVRSKLPRYHFETGERLLPGAGPPQQALEGFLSASDPGQPLRLAGRARLVPSGGKRASGRRWAKPSFRLDLEGSRRRVYLRTTWRDPVGLGQVLGFALYRQAGVLAPEARLVRLDVNGEFYGLYTEVEAVDEEFLLRRGIRAGEVVRPLPSGPQRSDARTLESSGQYRLNWSGSGLPRFQGLLEACSGPDGALHLREAVDIPAYLRYLAVGILLHHWDAIDRNFVWCYDADRGKWFVVPWDLDRTWGDHYEGFWNVTTAPLELGTKARPLKRRGMPEWNRLRTLVFEDPELLAQLRATLAALMSEAFSPEGLRSEVADLLLHSKDSILEDAGAWGTRRSRYDQREVELRLTERHVQQRAKALVSYAKARRQYLEEVLSEEPKSSPPGFDLGALLLLLLSLGVYLGRAKFRTQA